jgi:hypothetical protein
MVLHNPNNWHWVNKDATSWTRQWFEDNLKKIEAEEGDVKAKVSRVISMNGDVEVAQRKGKVITIFDVKLTLEYTGTCSHVPVEYNPIVFLMNANRRVFRVDSGRRRRDRYHYHPRGVARPFRGRVRL